MDIPQVSTKTSTETSAPAGPGGERWYAVRLRSHFELTASAALRERGYEEFLPLCRGLKRWSDRVKRVSVPLFPGYLFCRFDASTPYPVLNVAGVVHIVSAGNKPIPVEDGEIEAVRTICGSNLPLEPWTPVERGERIAVVRGPLKGTEGVVVKAKNQYRLVASISLLQRAVAAELELDWISPAV